MRVLFAIMVSNLIEYQILSIGHCLAGRKMLLSCKTMSNTQYPIPNGFARSVLLLLDKNVDAFFVRCHYVRQPIVIYVGDDELRANSGIIVNLVFDPSDLAAFAFKFEPDDHRRSVWIYVARRPMRPEAFAGDNVFQPVT